MSNFLFHNKFHRANHHTIATPGLPDSATDPIASQAEPFLGVFYNYQNAIINLSAIDISYLETFLTDSITTFDGLSVNTIQSIYKAISANIFTNSRNWYEMYTNISGFSGVYSLYPTVSTTVQTFSGSWNLGYSCYSALTTLSTNFFSTYTIVNSYSANWPFIDTTLRTNLTQENTRAKNFKGATMIFNSNSGYWNLSSMQVAFAAITADSIIKNVVPAATKKKGGEYILVLQQDGFGNRTVTFEDDYVFRVVSPTYSLTSKVIYGTGDNTYGQLGQRDNNNKSKFQTVLGRWQQIVSGEEHTFALSANSDRWFSVGYNLFGQLGLGDDGIGTDRNVLTQVQNDLGRVVCGGYHTLASDANSPKKWLGTGYNLFGQLGLGDVSNRNTFTSLTGNWDQMVCGEYNTFALSGGVWHGTGYNAYGQLGLGDTANRNAFTPLTGNWSQIICGAQQTFALSANTSKWYATGRNDFGQLGLGDTSNRSVFTPITGNWNKISAGGYHSFALSGTKIYSTGRNSFGQLGLGDTSHRNVFTPLTGDWYDIACGGLHTFALTALTGSRWFSAGYNGYGQLGLDSTTDASTFVPVSGSWENIIINNAGSQTFAISAGVAVDTFYIREIFIRPYQSNVISLTALSVTVIRFVCDGNKLWGKPTAYYYERDTIWTYFAGAGLIFNPSPAEFYINDYFIPVPGAGLTIQGVVVPAAGYTNGGGINIVSGPPGP